MYIYILCIHRYSCIDSDHNIYVLKNVAVWVFIYIYKIHMYHIRALYLTIHETQLFTFHKPQYVCQVCHQGVCPRLRQLYMEKHL